MSESPAMKRVFDVESVREQFMLGWRETPVYLDNAASSQIPQPVVDPDTELPQLQPLQHHRGVHTLSQRATTQYEEAGKVQHFIGAEHLEEVLFTSGTTASLNLSPMESASRPTR